MISVAHGITGGVMGVLVRHPAGALLAGILSHVALDETPHWDYRTPAHAALDLLVTALALGALGWYLSRRHRPDLVAALVAGAIGGLLPDLEVAIGYFYHQKMLFPTHSGLLPHPQVHSALGIWTQVLVVGFDLLFLWFGVR
ncbi:MAG TPA: hypothetical protein GXX55_02875 [Firmicutes bacterium]|nr:hypothetical protein [Bacillota bacterium]